MTDLTFKKDELPVRSELIVLEEFILQCDCAPDILDELREMGWLKPAKSARQGDLYSNTDVYKVRKLVRICHDFELPLMGGTIIVDLLKRVNDLENIISRLESQIR